MRRSVTVAFCLLVVVVPSSLAATARTPALALARRAPLEIRGTGFRAHELVTVRAARTQVRVRVTLAGSFLAVFTTGDRCSAGRVVAVGSTGDRATLVIPPALCPAP